MEQTFEIGTIFLPKSAVKKQFQPIWTGMAHALNNLSLDFSFQFQEGGDAKGCAI